MTQTTDSAAIVTANELLADADATVEALRDAQEGIRDELRRHDQHPRREVSMATSLEQRKAWQQENAAHDAEGEILTRLFRLLGDAIQRRQAQDAIEGAEGDRAALEKALEQAQRARQAADAAAADALAQAQAIAAGRAAAGHPGRRVVGATAAQVDSLLALVPDDMLNDPERKRLRLHCQLDEQQEAKA